MTGSLAADLRFAIRMMRRHAVFTAVVVSVLALGIGANSAVFSVVNGILLRPLPYPEPARLVKLSETSASGTRMSVSNPNFLDWREQSRSFAAMAGYHGSTFTVLGGREPALAQVFLVSRDFFSVLGVEPALGRTFLPEESRLGGRPAAVVSDRFWRRNLEAAPLVDGKLLTALGVSFEVVGVMRPGFHFPGDADMWIPRELFEDTSDRSAHNLDVVARLAPGVSLDGARQDLHDVFGRIESVYPELNTSVGIGVVPLAEDLVGGVQSILLILMGAIGFVLLIACANVANLMLVRAAARGKELAIRVALGASRLRVVRQLLIESVVMACLGALPGLLLARWAVKVLIRLAPSDLPRLGEVTIDGRVLLFTALLAVGTGLVFGLVPALKVSRPDLRESMNESNRSGQGVERSRWRFGLMVAEVALTFVLLVGAGLIIKSFWRLLGVDPGFSSANVLEVGISLPPSTYVEDHQVVSFYDLALEQLAAVPGLEAVGLVNNVPLGGRENFGTFYLRDRPGEAGGAGYRVVSPEYFQALAVPLLKGRPFDRRDHAESPHTVLVNQALAERYWPGQDPLGRQIRLVGMDSHEDTWLTVIGVVGNVRHRSLDRESNPEAYVSYRQRPDRAVRASLLVRARGSELEGIATAVRERLRAVDANVPLSFEPFTEVVERSFAPQRFNMLLLSLFAAAALVLAVVGTYSVIAFSVAQRTQELSIRLALGAEAMDILKLVIRQGMVMIVVGLAIGSVLALALTRVLSHQLYLVTAYDPSVFVLVCLILAAAAVAACYLPARRSTHLDPATVLRAT